MHELTMKEVEQISGGGDIADAVTVGGAIGAAVGSVAGPAGIAAGAAYGAAAGLAWGIGSWLGGAFYELTEGGPYNF